MIIEPLLIDFEVGVSPPRAFELWATRCAPWWPPSHTVSGDPAAITFESRRGGRIVERARSGDEHVWGEILDWEPPARLRYLWHLFFDPAEATEVEVTFSPIAGGTAVRLEQRGWERLGDAGAACKERTHAAWSTITARYAGAC
jgi:uncharacterized protein YndB with AHSA1/START domain